MIKKIFLLIGLSVFAITGAASILWASMVVAGGEVRSINDINETYRLGSGFSNTHTIFEPAPNGTLGTTVVSTLTMAESAVLESSLKALEKDISQVSDSQLINLDLTINYNMNHTFRLHYYPTTPKEYGSPEFANIISLFTSAAEKGYAEFELTIYPITSGRYVIASATDIEKDTNPGTQQPEFLQTLTEYVGLNPGDVYDVTYSNKQSETNPTPGFVGFGIQTFYNSDLTYQNAMKIDFTKLEAFRNGGNSFIGATFVKFIRNDNVNNDQLIVLIPEADQARLQEISSKMYERGVSKVTLPASFTIYVRYSLDGSNILTFRNNYAY